MAVLGTLLPGSFAAEDPSLDRGFHYLYNLQFDDAQAQFYGWQQRFRDDPVGPAAESAAYLFQEFESAWNTSVAALHTRFPGSNDES
jgi:hypothetical protein